MKQEVVTVGLDLAKSVFQVHAIGRDGAVLVRRAYVDMSICRYVYTSTCLSTDWGLYSVREPDAACETAPPHLLLAPTFRYSRHYNDGQHWWRLPPSSAECNESLI